MHTVDGLLSGSSGTRENTAFGTWTRGNVAWQDQSTLHTVREEVLTRGSRGSDRSTWWVARRQCVILHEAATSVDCVPSSMMSFEQHSWLSHEQE